MRIEPYYDHDGIQIYHGDALTLLPFLEIDGAAAVVTDVPYASGARTEAQKSRSGAMVRGAKWDTKPIENDQMTTTGFIWMIRELCYAVRPRLIDGGSFLTFIDWRQWPHLVGAVETTNLRVNQMIVWDKLHYGMGAGFRTQHELILHASKDTARIFDHGTGNVLRFKRVDNEYHPSPKPPELLEKLIRVVSRPGELIVDPMCGAGSTLIAAKMCGRRAIGIEIEEKHCRSAATLCDQQVLTFTDETKETGATQLELIAEPARDAGK